jgi:hypothetical protein
MLDSSTREQTLAKQSTMEPMCLCKITFELCIKIKSNADIRVVVPMVETFVLILSGLVGLHANGAHLVKQSYRIRYQNRPLETRIHSWSKAYTFCEISC